MRHGDAWKLMAVRLVHTAIYIVNAGACFVVLFAGLTGTMGSVFLISVVLIAGEAAVLLANGLNCPLSAVAERYGARESEIFYDTFLPERLTRYTVHFFSFVILVGLLLIGLRAIGLWS